MTHAREMLAGIAGAFVLGAGAIAADTADSSSNPYQGIVERNAFALKPPPPLPDTTPEKPPAPKFFLTGITDIVGKKLALFKSDPTPGKPGQPASKEESYMLAEGQRQGDVEVMTIDKIARIVKMSYAGTVMTLDFTNNAAKVAAGAPPPGGAPGVPGQAPPPGIAIPGRGATAHSGFRQPGAADNERRPIRTGGGLGMARPPMGMGVGQMQTGMAAQEPPALITRDQQEVLMEAMREQQRDNPEMPPLPPTSLTPLIEAANQEAAARASSANPVNPATGFGPPVPPAPPAPGRLY
jgi:hypothetical protein